MQAGKTPVALFRSINIRINKTPGIKLDKGKDS